MSMLLAMAAKGTSVFVVSDLHIGGADGFQMISRETRQKLAALFRWVADQATADRDVQLVIAGDIVDFLAEEPFEAFTANEDAAAIKLRTILAASDEVWQGLAAATKRCAVTFMLGNHDIELSFPKLRRMLLQRVGGTVEFLCDNEAFVLGDLIIEHGNRYDGWNAVDHDGLRQLRSSSSRREPAPSPFSVQPGSELVARVMNQYKKKYPWVDLLKPETAGVIPILAALGGPTWKIAADAAKAAAGAAWRQSRLGSGGTPDDPRFISESKVEAVPAPLPIDELQEVFALFDEAPAAAASSAADGRMVGEGAVTLNEELLFRGLRRWGEKDNRSFHIDTEKKEYLTAANLLAERRHKVIVFGHTHLAKNIELGSGARYLNSGTWADLMCIPKAIFADDEHAARVAFSDFIVALKTRAPELRKPLPTFARIELDELRQSKSANVHFFDGPNETPAISTEEIEKRVGR